MLTTEQHIALNASAEQFGKDRTAATAMHREVSERFGFGRDKAAYDYGHARAYAMEANAQFDHSARRAAILAPAAPAMQIAA